MRGSRLGEFEEIVLLTVAVLFDEAYGIAVKKEIEARLDRKISVGALHTAFNRLEKKGFLQSRLGEATASRGGKRKRYFQVTASGFGALKTVRQTRNEFWEAIPEIAFK
ncbi:MAG: helix-turn-helix transcriptional regulator [Bacteroidota bacterium]